MERINEMLIEQKRINIEQMRVNEEQKRINEELMSQIRQMQMEILKLSGGGCGNNFNYNTGMLGIGYGEDYGGGKMNQNNMFMNNRISPYTRNPGGGRLGFNGVTNNGEWYCPKCGNLNYEKREKCNMRTCDFEKKDLNYVLNGGNNIMGMGTNFNSRGPEPRPGDWDCPRCLNVNFFHRTKCNGKSNGVYCNLKRPEFASYGVNAYRKGEARQPGDWACFRCGNINLPDRDTCNKCEISREDGSNWEAFKEDSKGDF